ncbi:sulfate adenylyltransferase subunit CysN [Aliamphritea spongicola]|uniref:sulfate adenylyltransferase subunit CysN n=1 Tax=Aliamphritea spongicola TaxID=707589 RepID=UPI00196AA02D|nr:sulfate adenylyltransferase subunit CysN [Aliamphritea spongicola]MBN3564447.1 sulfate adenylyltransferase subunit CysN [Aliamphritea spongicola]
MSHQSELIAEDINAYLTQHENKELLRFLTCGSVDDGKSTLIGRLLHDTKMLYEDQLAALHADNAKQGNAGEALDLALLVDGLQAEREQGITIDVAYRYFSTDKRKFIIADTPGHEQYTRNMATGASTCDLAIILIDARYGVQVQTKRHSFIASLLGIKHTVVAINKMDLVDFSQERFEEIKQDYLNFSANLNLQDIRFVPISALNGDNVVTASEHTPWYRDGSLMEILENVELEEDNNQQDLRFPVQYVNRPNLDFRGYCGTIASGSVKPGDQITVLPSGKHSTVKSIITMDGELASASAQMAVTLTLEDEIDISRGDTLVHSEAVPETHERFDANLVWLTDAQLETGRDYDIKLATQTLTGKISSIRHRVDVNTQDHQPAASLNLNEIGRCEISLEQAIIADDYQQVAGTGSFIVIDRLTNATVAAGMIVNDQQAEEESVLTDGPVTGEAKAQRFGQKPFSLVITGENDQSRTQLLNAVEQNLFRQGRAVVTLNADDLGDNTEVTANLLNQQGLIVLISARENVEGAYHVDLNAGDAELSLNTDRTSVQEQYEAIMELISKQL